MVYQNSKPRGSGEKGVFSVWPASPRLQRNLLLGVGAMPGPSLADPKALAIHSRVIRWSLDEFAPPAPLLRSVVDLLYRKDRFARNELRLRGGAARSASLAEIPIAAIVDHTSRLVPPSSALEPLSSLSVFAYVPEIGVGLQHVGPLVGRRAHREIWPRVIDWMRGAHRQSR